MVNVDGTLHLRPEGAVVGPDESDPDEPGAENADGGENQGQDGHGDEDAPEARRQDLLEGIDPHHLHGGDLLARAHEADLGGERRARAAGKEKRRHHGSEFTHEGKRHQHPKGLFAAVAHERVVALQTEHEAHEEARDGDDEKRPVAEKVNLLHHGPAPRAGELSQHLHGEEAEFADAAAFPDDGRPEIGNPPDHADFSPRKSTRRSGDG